MKPHKDIFIHGGPVIGVRVSFKLGLVRALQGQHWSICFCRNNIFYRFNIGHLFLDVASRDMSARRQNQRRP